MWRKARPCSHALWLTNFYLLASNIRCIILRCWKGEVANGHAKSGTDCFGLLLFAGLASAQVPTHGNVFFGYSYYNTDVTSVGSANTNGWEASVEGKIIPWFGMVADFDTHYGSQNFRVACPTGVDCTGPIFEPYGT